MTAPPNPSHRHTITGGSGVWGACAPPHLTKMQAEIWESLAPEFDLSTGTARLLLETVAVQLGRAKQACEQVEKDGLMIMINDGKTEVSHPLIRVDQSARSLANRSLAELRRKHAVPAQVAKAARNVVKKSPRTPGGR